jgi:hypothetical protein
VLIRQVPRARGPQARLLCTDPQRSMRFIARSEVGTARRRWEWMRFCFWNSLVEATSSVYHSALRQEIRLALDTDLQYEDWVAKVICVLNHLGHDWGEAG